MMSFSSPFQCLASATVEAGSSEGGFLVLQVIGVLLGVLGLIFFLGAAVGLVRFPDFYTRLHAAGKGDTLSTMLMLTGFALVTMEDFFSQQLVAPYQNHGGGVFYLPDEPYQFPCLDAGRV